MIILASRCVYCLEGPGFNVRTNISHFHPDSLPIFIRTSCPSSIVNLTLHDLSLFSGSENDIRNTVDGI